MGNYCIHRRRLIQAASGTIIGLSLAGCTGSGRTQSGGGNGGTNNVLTTEPDYDGYLDDANLYAGQTLNRTGQNQVTVRNGAGDQGFAFDPPAIAVSPGTTVIWEWTGEGGAHNVNGNTGEFTSGDPEHGTDISYQHEFNQPGVFLYHCVPHEAAGMKGAVTVVE